MVHLLILDSHAYCFPPGDNPAGYASTAERLAWLQTAHTHHHQPAWRIRDRAPVSSACLGEETPLDWSRLPDVDFRIDRDKGRVVWTADGEDCTKQFFPPNLRNLAFGPHSLIAEMDYAGVDGALLHTNPMLGRDPAYLADCIRSYPDRLRAMAPVDEWRIPTEPDAVVGELRDAISVHGLHAIKFNTRAAYAGSPDPWDDGPYRPLWEAAVSLDVPIFFTLSAGPGTAALASDGAHLAEGYLNEQRILMAWMDRYPDAICSLTHGFPWRIFVDGDRIELPEDIWRPFANPNLSLEVCLPVRIGDLFEYPYREVHVILEEMVTRVGADRLMWGTDMPFQNRFCTYRQSRTWIERHCGFLTDEQRAAILGGTAARILSL